MKPMEFVVRQAIFNGQYAKNAADPRITARNARIIRTKESILEFMREQPFVPVSAYNIRRNAPIEKCSPDFIRECVKKLLGEGKLQAIKVNAATNASKPKQMYLLSAGALR